MGCSVQCQETGKCCGNKDVGLVCTWLDMLITSYQENPAISMEDAIKKCSKTHYDALGMDEILEPYLGKAEEFFDFLRGKWNWIVTMDPEGKRIIADENGAVHLSADKGGSGSYAQPVQPFGRFCGTDVFQGT